MEIDRRAGRLAPGSSPARAGHAASRLPRIIARGPSWPASRLRYSRGSSTSAPVRPIGCARAPGQRRKLRSSVAAHSGWLQRHGPAPRLQCHASGAAVQRRGSSTSAPAPRVPQVRRCPGVRRGSSAVGSSTAGRAAALPRAPTPGGNAAGSSSWRQLRGSSTSAPVRPNGCVVTAVRWSMTAPAYWSRSVHACDLDHEGRAHPLAYPRPRAAAEIRG